MSALVDGVVDQPQNDQDTVLKRNVKKSSLQALGVPRLLIFGGAESGKKTLQTLLSLTRAKDLYSDADFLQSVKNAIPSRMDLIEALIVTFEAIFACLPFIEPGTDLDTLDEDEQEAFTLFKPDLKPLFGLTGDEKDAYCFIRDWDEYYLMEPEKFKQMIKSLQVLWKCDIFKTIVLEGNKYGSINVGTPLLDSIAYLDDLDSFTPTTASPAFWSPDTILEDSQCPLLYPAAIPTSSTSSTSSTPESESESERKPVKITDDVSTTFPVNCIATASADVAYMFAEMMSSKTKTLYEPDPIRPSLPRHLILVVNLSAVNLFSSQGGSLLDSMLKAMVCCSSAELLTDIPMSIVWTRESLLKDKIEGKYVCVDDFLDATVIDDSINLESVDGVKAVFMHMLTKQYEAGPRINTVALSNIKQYNIDEPANFDASYPIAQQILADITAPMVVNYDPEPFATFRRIAADIASNDSDEASDAIDSDADSDDGEAMDKLQALLDSLGIALGGGGDDDTNQDSADETSDDEAVDADESE